MVRCFKPIFRLCQLPLSKKPSYSLRAHMWWVLRLNQVPCVCVFSPWTPGLLPPPGYSEFWLNRVSSDSPRPAFSALGTDPEVGPLGHAAALVCDQEACISCGAGSAEQAHRAPEPRRDVHHVCLRCGGQGERFQHLLKLLVIKIITQA